MFDQPYTFDYLGKTATLVPDPIIKEIYRFQAKYRRYLVTFEVYSFGLTAVKYCDIRDRNAGNRYEKVFDDGDAFKVITTCLYIMLDYWKRNPTVSFSFYAVPRKWEAALLKGKQLSAPAAKLYIERYKKVRYAIYDYAMINLFPPVHFTHIRDPKNAVYVLLNKSQPRTDPKAILLVLGQFLLQNYKMIVEPEDA